MVFDTTTKILINNIDDNDILKKKHDNDKSENNVIFVFKVTRLDDPTLHQHYFYYLGRIIPFTFWSELGNLAVRTTVSWEDRLRAGGR